MSESDIDAKPAQSGLVDVGDIEFYNDPSDPTPTFTISDLDNYVGSFSEIVLNVTWAELQPTAGGALNLSTINTAISAVDEYNTANGTDVGIKLRVWGGYTAPDWAKNIDGPPITVTGAGTIDPSSDATETIGRFWTADYNDAWTTLQNTLAADYDQNPVILGISNTAGASATDEPFVPLRPDQVTELEAGGYTDAAEELTLRNAISDYSGWSETPLDYTMNLFHLEGSGKVVGDPNVTLAVLQEAENSSRTVQAGNHALNQIPDPSDAFIYAQVAADAALDPTTVPGSFQTASPVNLGGFANWPSAIAEGVASDAGDIELWDGPGTTGFTGESQPFVAGLAGTLADGVAPVTNAPDNGAQLAFIAPASVSGTAGAIAFTGTRAVLLASASTQGSYTITINSTNGNPLTVFDAWIPTTPDTRAAIFGAGGQLLTPGANSQTVSSTSLSFSGSLALVNTILASLTDTVTTGTDVVTVVGTDGDAHAVSRNIGVVTASVAAAQPVTNTPSLISSAGTDPTTFQWTGDGGPSLFSDPANWSPMGGPPSLTDTAEFDGLATPTVVAGTGAVGTAIIDDTVVVGGQSDIAIGQNGIGDVDIADQTGTEGTLILGGVNSTLSIAGNLAVGGTNETAGGNGTVIAALSPSSNSTADLTIGGTLKVWEQGTLRFSGALDAGTVNISSGGLVSGDGTLTATGGGAIVNDGTIEAVADFTLGTQELTAASPIAGTGTIMIDAGATFIAQDAIGPSETIVFATPDIAQLSADSYSPTTLELEHPTGFQGSITDFSWADSLVLDDFDGTSATYSSDGTLTIASASSTLAIDLTGDLTNLTPMLVTANSGTTTTTTVSFVAHGLGATPTVYAPPTLQAVVGSNVLVPNITLATPLPASPGDNDTIIVTLIAGTGTLSAGSDNGNTTISQPDSQTLILSGTLGAVETSLQSLSYQSNVSGADTISISVSDSFGMSSAAIIAVTDGTIGTDFDWTGTGGDSFDDANAWKAGGISPSAVPGGGGDAVFGPGTFSVSGDGAVGRITVNGSLTLTGAVNAQGLTDTNTVGSGFAAIVDGDGSLTLAGGATLTNGGITAVGLNTNGVLTVADGALMLTNASGESLVLGLNANSQGTVVDMEQIEAAGTLVVGAAGNGSLHLLGAAATLSDGGADIGQSPGADGLVVVDGGEWSTSGLLTVGDAGSGSIVIGGAASGITGQATAFDAEVGAQAGSHGTVTLQDGDLLIADGTAASSVLTVGGAGAGSLILDGSSNATVGAAQASVSSTPSGGGEPTITTLIDNTGTLTVGGEAGGSGVITIDGSSSLLVDGDGTIGGIAGTGTVIVGETSTDAALLALLGTLTIGATGQVFLGDALSTVRASAISLEAGATLSGAGTVSGDGGGNGTVMFATVANDGVIAAENGALLIYGPVSGSGDLLAGDNSTLTLQAAVTTGQSLIFDTNSDVTLNDVAAFQGTITQFSEGDHLDLASIDASGAVWNSGTLTLDTNDGALALNLEGNFAANAFTVQSDGRGGTVVELACFASGTPIATPTGERCVEDLSVGDLVTTIDGVPRPIVWVGRRRVDIARHPSPEAVRPVRITRHAFGQNKPMCDLYLSPDHAIMFEGVLIPIKYLVNGTNVSQIDASSVTYHHIELQEHDIILAAGLSTETFLSTSSRSMFENRSGPAQLHPDFGRSDECRLDASLVRDALACAPLFVVGPQVEHAHSLLKRTVAYERPVFVNSLPHRTGTSG
jgi:hypothetical protein